MKIFYYSVYVFLITSFNSFIKCSENDKEWKTFKESYGKVYSDLSQEMNRKLIWESNLEYIKNHNEEAEMGKRTYVLKMNKFGDLTNEEFGKIYNGFNLESKINTNVKSNLYRPAAEIEIPDSIDWRDKGYVTPVKDQSLCGSCWAFSAVASLEGQHFKKEGKLVSLSEQNLVDCSNKFGNHGCFGGLMDQAFTYIKVNKGIDTESSYPYKAENGKCKFDKKNIGATDDGYTDIESGNEAALTSAIATIGPISVAIDASGESFQFYSSGVYSSKDCKAAFLNHGITAVGYGSLNDQDYYIVKNSWGTEWGEKGYILIARNSNNMCGIASAASYPIV